MPDGGCGGDIEDASEQILVHLGFFFFVPARRKGSSGG